MIYVLESHPKDENIMLTAGHDGRLFVWDIYTGVSTSEWMN